MTTMHALFTTEVECKIAPVRADPNPMTLPHALDPSDAVRRAEDRLRKCGWSCKSVLRQLAREGSPPPGLRRPQARLSRTFN